MQKLGRGMYFALSAADALAFAQNRIYEYDYILTCELPFAERDFYDLRDDANAVNKWTTAELQAGRLTQDALNKMRVHDRHIAFCTAHSTKGLIWQATGQYKWAELVVLEPFVGDGALILSAQQLPPRAANPAGGTAPPST
ncbi:hypothetical protein [Sorangium sp. So ce406]|uniref:hypothetical protein n=1 Tax=Sorangium sp. So ce406 TaxID=3133311 RepID=UPI003F5C60B0